MIDANGVRHQMVVGNLKYLVVAVKFRKSALFESQILIGKIFFHFPMSYASISFNQDFLGAVDYIVILLLI